MERTERQTKQIHALLKEITEKRKQLKEKIQKGRADPQSLAALRVEDKLIAHVIQSGRAAVSRLELMKHPEVRKRIVSKAFGDDDPRTVIKELKNFSKSLDAIRLK